MHDLYVASRWSFLERMAPVDLGNSRLLVNAQTSELTEVVAPVEAPRISDMLQSRSQTTSG